VSAANLTGPAVAATAMAAAAVATKVQPVTHTQ
jgi:hypothetical protein